MKAWLLTIYTPSEDEPIFITKLYADKAHALEGYEKAKEDVKTDTWGCCVINKDDWCVEGEKKKKNKISCNVITATGFYNRITLKKIKFEI